MKNYLSKALAQLAFLSPAQPHKGLLFYAVALRVPIPTKPPVCNGMIAIPG